MMIDVKHTTIKTLKFKLNFNFKVVLVFSWHISEWLSKMLFACNAMN